MVECLLYNDAVVSLCECCIEVEELQVELANKEDSDPVSCSRLACCFLLLFFDATVVHLM